MKTRIYNSYATLRREFRTISEISEVINRGPNYIVDRLKGKKPFTDREQRLLLRHLGQDPTDPEAIAFYFSEAES